MKSAMVLLVIVLAGLLSVVVSGPAFGEEDAQTPEDSGYAKSGVYVGISGVETRIDGSDFDGNGVQSCEYHTFIVPEFNPHCGFGLTLGDRGRNVAGEVCWTTSDHDIESNVAHLGSAWVNTFDFSVKRYFLWKTPIQPYVQLGATWMAVDAEDIAIDLSNGSRSGGWMSGWGLNAGAGVAAYITPQLAVTGGVVWRGLLFDDFGGYDVTGVEASMLTYTVGLTYTF